MDLPGRDAARTGRAIHRGCGVGLDRAGFRVPVLGRDLAGVALPRSGRLVRHGQADRRAGDAARDRAGVLAGAPVRRTDAGLRGGSRVGRDSRDVLLEPAHAGGGRVPVRDPRRLRAREGDRRGKPAVAGGRLRARAARTADPAGARGAPDRRRPRGADLDLVRRVGDRAPLRLDGPRVGRHRRGVPGRARRPRRTRRGGQRRLARRGATTGRPSPLRRACASRRSRPGWRSSPSLPAPPFSLAGARSCPSSSPR